ncbi:hypothetical protein IUJ34_09820 [Klebsiella pneumoniae subsp. pneumoniae]|uniref:Uncharacterized protein n=1 Tax=Klebsiella pneumoniae subsp. pneumoniae TaxID=72407 RepID=A0A7S9E1A7_KLEPN|nr:hypothetical protein IUJ34_09820 [Klebsiella pneumoniae subsp. pneumoniae]
MHINNIISGTPQAHIPRARQAQRRRGGPPVPYPPLCRMAASPYPAYGSSRKSLYTGPGKRSAAGQDTADTIPAFVPDGGFALSGLRHPPVSLYCAAE